MTDNAPFSRATGRGRHVIPDDLLRTLFTPLLKHNRAALAVSGGSDSVALMHLAARWCSIVARHPNSFTVLTVDHGLREGSCGEAEEVARRAEQLGFGRAVLTWDGVKPRTRLQEQAREARYALMTAYCRAHGLTALVTAHTMEDQAETLILRLARGSGVDGLSAMAAEAEVGGVSLLRPLLGVSRARLRGVLRAAGETWIDDPSNENLAFERIRIRKAARHLAALGVTPAAIARSAARLRYARDALDESAGHLFSDIGAFKPEGYAVLDRVGLARAPFELAIRVLSRLIRSTGGQTAPRRAKLEKLMRELKSGGKCATLGGCVFDVSGDTLRIFREAGRMDSRPLPIAPGHTLIWDGRFRVSLAASARVNACVAPLGEPGWRAVVSAHAQASSKTAARSGLPPRLAGIATPALWERSTLLHAPLLDWKHPRLAECTGTDAGLSAQFLPFLEMQAQAAR